MVSQIAFQFPYCNSIFVKLTEYSKIYVVWTVNKMRAIKRSLGIAPEVNPRNPLHTVMEAGKNAIHPVFET